MALAQDQIAIVNRIRASLSADLTISDEDVYALYTSAGSDEAVLAILWDRTAVLYAGLVTVREGSSTRDFGSLYTRALELAALYRGRADAAAGAGAARRTKSRAIVRP